MEQNCNFFSRLYRNSLDGIIIVNAENGKIIDINRAVERITGYSLAEVEGANYSLFFPEELEDGPRHRIDNFNIFDYVVDSTEIRDKAGKTIFIDMTVSLLETEDNEIRMIITIRDISRRRTLYNRLINYDPLTGLLNRRSFEERLQADLLKIKRYGGELSLLMVDIDHFKSVNDTYGHDTGDRVLIGVSSCLRENVRNVDYTARIGGEEFVIIMPETDLESCYLTAERIREKVKSTIYPLYSPPGELKVSISGGVASAPFHSIELKQLMKMADMALYQAKEGGRDRIIRYEKV